MQMRTSVAILIQFLTVGLATSQNDKTSERETQILKDNRVAIKRTWSTIYQDNDNEIQIDRNLQLYEQFDRNGNIILRLRFNNVGDTLEKNTFVRNDKGQVFREYRDCLDTCLVWYWESSYDQGKLDNATAFSRDSSVVASSKYFYNEQGLVSKYYSSRREETVVSTSLDDGRSGDPITNYHTIYETDYDTTIVEYSGDTIRHSSNHESQSSLYTEKYNEDGFMLEESALYNSKLLNYTERYEYDSFGNRVIRLITSSNMNEPYLMEKYIYDARHLMVKMEYYHTKLDIPQVISEFEYELLDE